MYSLHSCNHGYVTHFVAKNKDWLILLEEYPYHRVQCSSLGTNMKNKDPSTSLPLTDKPWMTVFLVIQVCSFQGLNQPADHFSLLRKAHIFSHEVTFLAILNTISLVNMSQDMILYKLHVPYILV